VVLAVGYVSECLLWYIYSILTFPFVTLSERVFFFTPIVTATSRSRIKTNDSSCHAAAKHGAAIANNESLASCKKKRNE